MEYPSWYMKVSRPFRNPAAARSLDIVDRSLAIAIAGAYLAALAWLALKSDLRLIKALLVPALTFLLVTIIRKAFDKPRPYALYDIDPVLVKQQQGKSFPSRHVSSAVIIACTLLWLDPVWGIPSLTACALVAIIRIVGGVHFPRDVIAAIAISLCCAFIGFALIP